MHPLLQNKFEQERTEGTEMKVPMFCALEIEGMAELLEDGDRTSRFSLLRSLRFLL
jgi:hypothetical protein